jgi:hypothetical protein
MFISGPWLQAVTENSAVIMWEEDNAMSTWVEYGLDLENRKTSVARTILATSVDGDTSAIIHEAKLEGLEPGNLYTYKINAETEPLRRFRTPTKNFTFLHTSNPNAYAPAKAKTTLASMLKHNPDFVVMSGDISNKATNNDYRNFFQKGGDLSGEIPLYTCQGNHDSRTWSTYADWMSNDFADSHNESFFSFRIGNAKFIGIDDNVHHTGFPFDWFRSQFGKGDAVWTILFMNGNYKNKGWLLELIDEIGSDIDVILTAGSGAQFIDDHGVLHLESGGGEYVYQSIQVSESDHHSLSATLFDRDGNHLEAIKRSKEINGDDRPPAEEPAVQIYTANTKMEALFGATFSKPGRYLVDIAITDEDGDTFTETRTIHIEE